MQARWSRRRFLQVAATTTAALGTRSLLRAADSNDRFAGFPLGMQSYTLRDFKIDQVLVEIKNLGLHNVELFNAHFPANSSDADIEAMKSKTKALGITMRGHGVNPMTKDHEANRRWFEFAKKAGIKNISADPTEDSFDSLDKLCEEYQIRIAIHNHGPAPATTRSPTCCNAIQRPPPADRRLRRPGALHPQRPKIPCERSTCSKDGCTACTSRTSPSRSRRPRA